MIQRCQVVVRQVQGLQMTQVWKAPGFYVSQLIGTENQLAKNGETLEIVHENLGDVTSFELQLPDIFVAEVW